MPPRGLQFTIGTLLLMMAWVGLICVAVRNSTEFWTLMVFLATFVLVFTSALACVYGTGPRRALALGFLLFSVGYVLCVTMLPGSLVLPFWWDKQASPLVKWLSSQVRTPTPSSHIVKFQAVCHLVLATVLGLLGGLIGRFVYLTCRRTSTDNRP
jgi:hypothetical protein